MISTENTAKTQPERPIEVDVLFIHPSKFQDKADYCIMPVGVVGILNTLRDAGFTVIAVNQGLELSLGNFQLETYLRCYNPAIVMVDLHWYEHSAGAIDVAKLVKELLPRAQILVGGLTASYFSHELCGLGCFDYVVVGDGELGALSVCNVVLRGKGELENAIDCSLYGQNQTVLRRQPDLNCLNFVDLDWLHNEDKYYKCDVEGYREFYGIRHFWLCIARGCVFNCSYCGGTNDIHESVFGRSGFNVRSPDRVVRDIRLLLKKAVTRVDLSHDLSLFGRTYWAEFFRLMVDGGVSASIYMEVWQLPNSSFVENFAASVNPFGSRLAIAPLSGDEVVRKTNGKFYTNEKLLRFLSSCGKTGLGVDIYFSSNLPGETRNSFQETLRLARRIEEECRDMDANQYCQPHTIDPGSPMFADPNRFGISRTFDSFQDYVDYCRVRDRVEALGLVYQDGVGHENQAQWNGEGVGVSWYPYSLDV